MANVEVYRDVVASAKDEAVALMDGAKRKRLQGVCASLGEEVGRLYQTLNDEFLGRQTARRLSSYIGSKDCQELNDTLTLPPSRS